MGTVVVLGTGGTIASEHSAGAGAVASLRVADLLHAADTRHTVVSRDLMTVGSYRLTLADMRRISNAARAAAAEPGVLGVVVTHGTDTMEETAFLTGLAHSGSSPIIFTGAQFAADDLSSDGTRNLRDAVDFASATVLQGSGVGISFGGELYAARGTRKWHSTAPQPFGGGTLVASRAGSKVTLHAHDRSEPEPIVPHDAFDDLIIDMVMSYPGADVFFLEQAVARADAVILVGTGVGNAAPGFAECVSEATTRDVPVILSSRVAAGPITPVYGNGGGIDLVRAGAVPAGTLSPQQARILTAALLGSPTRSDEPFVDRFRQHT